MGWPSSTRARLGAEPKLEPLASERLLLLLLFLERLLKTDRRRLDLEEVELLLGNLATTPPNTAMKDCGRQWVLTGSLESLSKFVFCCRRSWRRYTAIPTKPMAATQPTLTPTPIPIFVLVMSPVTVAELVKLFASSPLLLPPFDWVDDAEAPGEDNVPDEDDCALVPWGAEGATLVSGLLVVVSGLLGSLTVGWFPDDGEEEEPSLPAEEESVWGVGDGLGSDNPSTGCDLVVAWAAVVVGRLEDLVEVLCFVVGFLWVVVFALVRVGRISQMVPWRSRIHRSVHRLQQWISGQSSSVLHCRSYKVGKLRMGLVWVVTDLCWADRGKEKEKHLVHVEKKLTRVNTKNVLLTDLGWFMVPWKK